MLAAGVAMGTLSGLIAGLSDSTTLAAGLCSSVEPSVLSLDDGSIFL